MRRLAIFVIALTALPAPLLSQEAKLTNCRTLEAAGNFVGPDEVLDGDRVCKKAKPNDVSTSVKPEQPKPVVVETVSVADAARANAEAKAAAAKKMDQTPLAAPKPEASSVAEPAKAAAPVAVAAAPAPVVAAKPSETAPAPQPAVAAAPQNATKADPAAAADPEPATPAFGSVVAPAASTQPVAKPATVASTPAPAQPVRIHRDAPVAAGTPSEPPEKDYGFSDANAVEPAHSAKAGANGNAGPATPGSSVQTGGFDKPASSGADVAAQPATSDCAKNITLGTLRDGKLTLGVPAWAETWIAANRARLASTCFSPAPVKSEKNYLIVFYTAPGNGQGGANAALPLPDSASGAGAFAVKDGTSWQYSGEAAVTSSAENSATQVWYATAYSEQGAPVAERWPDAAKRGDDHSSQDLLAAIVDDLRKM